MSFRSAAMSKLILASILLILSLCGCSKKDEASSTSFKLRHLTAPTRRAPRRRPLTKPRRLPVLKQKVGRIGTIQPPTFHRRITALPVRHQPLSRPGKLLPPRPIRRIERSPLRRNRDQIGCALVTVRIRRGGRLTRRRAAAPLWAKPNAFVAWQRSAKGTNRLVSIVQPCPNRIGRYARSTQFSVTRLRRTHPKPPSRIPRIRQPFPRHPVIQGLRSVTATAPSNSRMPRVR